MKSTTEYHFARAYEVHQEIKTGNLYRVGVDQVSTLPKGRFLLKYPTPIPAHTWSLPRWDVEMARY